MPPTAHPLQSPRGRNAASAFWALMHQVALVAGCTHVVFIGVFYALGAPVLAAVNVGSVALFAAAYACLKMRRNTLASALIVLEILFHAALAVRAIGWESGFHYYLLDMAPVVVISRVPARIIKPLLIALLIVFYLVLDYTMRHVAPYNVLGAGTMSALRGFNIVTSFLLLSYLASLYLKLVTQAEKRLRLLATTDPLTGLLNRRSMLERAQKEVLKRQPEEPAPLAFVLADIDHFKAINDTHGHDSGDAVLTAVSEVLQQSVREQDSVARWGGEEFMILMPGASLDEASAVAERLREQVAATEVTVQGSDGATQRLRVSMTFGVGLLRHDERVDDPVKRADLALYRGKTSGRNQVVTETALAEPAQPLVSVRPTARDADQLDTTSA